MNAKEMNNMMNIAANDALAMMEKRRKKEAKMWKEATQGKRPVIIAPMNHKGDRFRFGVVGSDETYSRTEPGTNEHKYIFINSCGTRFEHVGMNRDGSLAKEIQKIRNARKALDRKEQRLLKFHYSLKKPTKEELIELLTEG